MSVLHDIDIFYKFMLSVCLFQRHISEYFHSLIHVLKLLAMISL